MAFTENLTAYFADFGQAATLAGVAVRVIFDAPGSAQLGMSIESPQIQIATASVPTDYQGSILVLSRGSYRVREHTPDGTGMSMLTLMGPV